MTVVEAIEQVLTLNLFQPGEHRIVPIPAVWKPSRKGSNVYFVLGPNGSGKSFFRRLLEQFLMDRAGIKDVVSISMQGRCDPAFFHRFAVYGHENKHSTGLNSAMAAVASIRACQTRKSDHVLIWDEPDIGMDEESSAGLGECLREFASALPLHTRAVFVSTHSRELVKQVLDLDPNYLHLGLANPPPSLEEWACRQVKPRNPDTLRRICVGRYERIEGVLSPLPPEDDVDE